MRAVSVHIEIFIVEHEVDQTPIYLVVCNGAVYWSVPSPELAGALARNLFEAFLAQEDRVDGKPIKTLQAVVVDVHEGHRIIQASKDGQFADHFVIQCPDGSLFEKWYSSIDHLRDDDFWACRVGGRSRAQMGGPAAHRLTP